MVNNNDKDSLIIAQLGDRFLAMKAIAARLRVKPTAKDLRLFTALYEVLPEENKAELRRLLGR